MTRIPYITIPKMSVTAVLAFFKNLISSSESGLWLVTYLRGGGLEHVALGTCLTINRLHKG